MSTPILTIAIARLCVVLRELELAIYADMIEQDAHRVALAQAITDAAAALSSRSRQIRWERLGDDREAALATASRCSAASLACEWLTSALRALNGYHDAPEANAMAQEALRMLAWPEAKAAITAARSWRCAAQEADWSLSSSAEQRARVGEREALANLRVALDQLCMKDGDAAGIKNQQTRSQAAEVPAPAAMSPATEQEHRQVIRNLIMDREPIDETELWLVTESILGKRFSKAARDSAFEDMIDENVIQQNSSGHWERGEGWES